MLWGIPHPLLTVRRICSQIAPCYPDPECVAELRANKHKAEVYLLSDEISCRQALEKHPGHDLTNHVEKQSSNKQKKNILEVYNEGRHIREPCMGDLSDSDCQMSTIIQFFHIDQTCSAKCNTG